MGIIKAGPRIFAGSIIQRILCDCHTIATGKSAEDLANIIECFAESVRSTQSQLMEYIVGAIFHLQRVVIGKTGVDALTQYAYSTSCATQIRTQGLSWGRWHLRCGTGCNSSWDQVRKRSLKIGHKW